MHVRHSVGCVILVSCTMWQAPIKQGKKILKGRTGKVGMGREMSKRMRKKWENSYAEVAKVQDGYERTWCQECERKAKWGWAYKRVDMKSQQAQKECGEQALWSDGWNVTAWNATARDGQPGPY